MRKSSKITLWITIPLLVILIVLYGISTLKKELLIPGSDLVYSVFEAENNSYQSYEGLPNVYYCTNVPYTVDAPDKDVAHIGNGVIYSYPQISMFVYVTEIHKNTETDFAIMSEFPKAVLYNYNDSSVISDALVDSGYINGFQADYFVKMMQITDGVESAEAALVGYRVILADYDYDILVSVVTTQVSSDSLESTKRSVNYLLYSLRYNEDLAEELLENVPEETEEPDIIVSDDATELPVVDGMNEGDGGSFEGITDEEFAEASLPEVPADATYDYKEIAIDTTLSNVYMILYWENTSTMVECKLYDGTGIIYYEPIEYRAGHCIFDLGAIANGTYSLEILGLDYGNIQYDFVDTLP